MIPRITIGGSKRFRHVATTALAVVLLAQLWDTADAQRRYGRRVPTFDRNGVPTWAVDAEMPDEVFTFVRLRYDPSHRGGAWATDYPDAELNLSYRLQQLTSMRSHPDGKVLDITDPALFDHPFAYMIEPGDIVLSDDEAATLRK